MWPWGQGWGWGAQPSAQCSHLTLLCGWHLPLSAWHPLISSHRTAQLSVCQMQWVGLWLHTLGWRDLEIGHACFRICRRSLETLASSPAPTCDFPVLLWENLQICLQINSAIISPILSSLPSSRIGDKKGVTPLGLKTTGADILLTTMQCCIPCTWIPFPALCEMEKFKSTYMSTIRRMLHIMYGHATKYYAARKKQRVNLLSASYMPDLFTILSFNLPQNLPR